MTFLCYHQVVAIPHIVLVGLDAVGLAMFAVAGTEKSLEFGISPLIAILMGAITATGGGAVRDLLLIHIPAVLRTDIYATAAIFGSIVLVLTAPVGAWAKTGRFFRLSSPVSCSASSPSSTTGTYPSRRRRVG